MKTHGIMLRPIAAIAAAALCLLPLAASAQARRCTQETLAVRGTPVTIGYCIDGVVKATSGGEIAVPVQASYSAPGGSFQEILTLRFLSGEGLSRVIRNLDLAHVGSTGILHLTLAYGGSSVSIESATLTPGAITIK
jgi:hypothetical protein